MSFLPKLTRILTLSHLRLRLRHRFAVFLGTLSVLSLLGTLALSRYSLYQIEHQYERQGQMLSSMVGEAASLSLVLQDTQGLTEHIDRTIKSGHALAAAFFDTTGAFLAERQVNERLRPEDRKFYRNLSARWSQTIQGSPILLAFSEVTSNETGQQQVLGYALVAMPVEAVQAQKQASLVGAAVISALNLLLMLVVLRLIHRSVIRPVEALRQSFRQVQDGDYQVRLHLDQHDEIGELAVSFNAMVEAGAESRDALQQQSAQAEATRREAESLQQQAEQASTDLQRQISAISEVVAAVTSGDLTRRLDVHAADSTAPLMRQINGMIVDLENVIREVHLAGDELLQVADTIATATNEMSNGAQEQAAQTAEVAAAIEEMTVTIAGSSRHAEEANQMGRQASHLAEASAGIFGRTTEGMYRIANLVKESTEKVTDLGQASTQIGEIIEVIREIADQTNLLALNAAIEAARAGEHGRGFAVVADEVRKLSERTSGATREIGERIRRIQHSTGEVVTSMGRGRAEVESGMTLADEAQTAFRQIQAAINGMEDMINQIAAASQEQSVTSSQISRSVDTISTVANEVAGATASLAGTAETLNHRVATLRQLIERFRTRQSAGTPVATPRKRHHRSPKSFA